VRAESTESSGQVDVDKVVKDLQEKVRAVSRQVQQRPRAAACRVRQAAARPG
jgi:hypothetical protein